MFIQQGCNKLIKSVSKYFHKILLLLQKLYLKKNVFFWTFINESWIKIVSQFAQNMQKLLNLF